MGGSTDPSREKENCLGEKGKGKTYAPCEPNFRLTTRPRARTHERTKRNDLLVGLTPPNLRYEKVWDRPQGQITQVYIYIYRESEPFVCHW